MLNYLILSTVFLFNILQAQEGCYSLYIAGDVGMGIMNFRHCHDGIYNELFDYDFDDSSATFVNQDLVLIAGFRFGGRIDVSECWYAAMEGSFRSAKSDSAVSGITCFKVSEDCQQYRYCFADSASYIGGIHAHLGYKTDSAVAAYGIIGAEYLRAKIYQDYNFSDTALFGDLSLTNCYHNWGYSLGAGFVANLYCDLDLRLEVVYASLRNYSFNRCLDLKDALNKKYQSSNRIQVKPTLLYGVVSIAYNF
jgi:opacity protein-like surface antigen